MTMFSIVDASNGGKSLSVFYTDGDNATVPSTHPKFQDIVDLLLTGTATDEAVKLLVNTLQVVGEKLSELSERVTVTSWGVQFDGDPLRGELADVILEEFKKGDEAKFKPLVNFLEKAKQNPSVKSIDDLYRWIRNGDLTITPNGDFVAYKGVAIGKGGISQSISRGTAFVNGEQQKGNIQNPLGAIVTMPRSEVDPDSKSYCSVGLHVGTYSYANSFAQGRTLLIQVNPRDVIAVPEDCNGEKIRVCRYVVLTQTDQRLTERIFTGDYERDEYDEPEEDEYDEEDDYDEDYWESEYDGEYDDEDEEDEEEEPSVEAPAPATSWYHFS